MLARSVFKNFSKLTISHVIGATHPPILNKTIQKQLQETTHKHPEHMAVISPHQNKNLTYQKLYDQSKRIAANLLDLGVQPNQKIGLYFSNSIEWYLLQMACCMSDTILVTINPAYRHDDLKHCINSIELDVLIVSNTKSPTRVLDNVEWLIGEQPPQDRHNLRLKSVPSLKKIFVVDFIGESIANQNFIDFKEHLLDASPSNESQIQVKNIIHTNNSNAATNIQFTSGTTGLPKGAVLTHSNILNNGSLVSHRLGYHPNDKICVSVPLYHCFGMVMANLAAIVSGSTVIYPNYTFNADSCLDSIEKYKMTSVYGVPTMFLEMLKQQKAKPRDLRSLEHGVIAGSLCPEILLKRIHSEMDVKLVTVAYGMTETSPISFMTKKEDSMLKRTSTVGRIVANVEAKIVDEAGNTTAIGHPGELLVKGHSVMLGYYNNPEVTAKTIVDGWMYSGDLATMDEDGYLSIVGRNKDIINRGGEKIAPKEVEDHILAINNVENVQVVSVPDDKFGEEILALVKLSNPKQKFDIFCIKTELKDKLAHYKMPKYVWIVNDLPITVTGKPQKFKMRKEWEYHIKEIGTTDPYKIR